MRRVLIPGALAAVALVVAITLTVGLKNAFVSTGAMYLDVHAEGPGFITYVGWEYDVPLNKTVKELAARVNVTTFGVIITPRDGWRPGYTYVITSSATVQPPYANCTDGYFAIVKVGNTVYLIANATDAKVGAIVPEIGITRAGGGYLDSEWVYINIALPPKDWETLSVCLG